MIKKITIVMLLMLILVCNINNSYSETKKHVKKVDSTAKLPLAFKGYELYSWKEGNKWYYSILIGTNRKKSIEEIKAPKEKIKDISGLKQRLSRMSNGENVFWSKAQIAPPEELIKEIKNYCDSIGIKLYLPK